MPPSAIYLQARIDALYAELVALEASPVEEYSMDNSGARQQIRYRKRGEILDAIDRLEAQLARKSNKGGRILMVKRAQV